MSSKYHLVKILLKCFLLIATTLIVDFSLSIAINRSLRSVGIGELGFQHVKKMQYDIVIFGASKSITNYDPATINEITGLSCYNLGSTGGTILVQHPQVLRILESYAPRLIVFELIGDDLGEWLLSYKEGRVVDRMLPHSDLPQVNAALSSIDRWHRFKAVLKTYKYKDVVVEVLVRLLQSGNLNYNTNLGFAPKGNNRGREFKDISAEFDKRFDFGIDYKRSPVIEGVFDDLLTELVQNNVDAIFVHSPNYENSWNTIDPRIREMIEDKGFRYYNMGENLPAFDFSNADNYFDMLHMATIGAKQYSIMFSNFLLSLQLD